MLFQNAPNALNGIVLTVIRGLISQTDGALRIVSPLGHASHKLGATTMVFRAVILMNEQGLHIWKLVLDFLPTIGKAVSNKISCDAATGQIDKDAVMVWQQNPVRGHRCIWLEIMV